MRPDGWRLPAAVETSKLEPGAPRNGGSGTTRSIAPSGTFEFSFACPGTLLRCVPSYLGLRHCQHEAERWPLRQASSTTAVPVCTKRMARK